MGLLPRYDREPGEMIPVGVGGGSADAGRAAGVRGGRRSAPASGRPDTAAAVLLAAAAGEIDALAAGAVNGTGGASAAAGEADPETGISQDASDLKVDI